jgi:hypothetical protein
MRSSVGSKSSKLLWRTRRKKDQDTEIRQWRRVHLEGLQGFLCRCWDKEGVDCSVQPTTERGGGKEEQAIVGAVKAMLYDQDLPRFLWAEACNTAVYIQNRSPHKVLGRKTPEEVFTGRKLEVGHFRFLDA